MNVLIAQLLISVSIMLSAAMQTGNQATMQAALDTATQAVSFVQESGALNPATPVYQDDATVQSTPAATQNVAQSQDSGQGIGAADLGNMATSTPVNNNPSGRHVCYDGGDPHNAFEVYNGGQWACAGHGTYMTLEQYQKMIGL